MKKLFLLISLSIVSVFAQAQDDVCADWIGIAEMTMESRQGGVSVGESVKIVERVFEGEDLSLPLYIVDLAYQMPVFNSQNDKREAIETFSSLFAESCYAGEFG